MASITLEIVVGDLVNGDLDSYERKFNNFLTSERLKSFGLPGTVDDVQETDRDEDEPEDE